MINIKRRRIEQSNDKYERKKNTIKYWKIWKERGFQKTMINIKWKRIEQNNDKYETKENSIKQR